MITLVVDDKELMFEHSLVSLSEWEAEFAKPFYSPTQEKKTREEMERYFQHMLVKPKKFSHLVPHLTESQMLVLAEYTQESRTATTVRNIQAKSSQKENITSELIYYWLVAFRIPFTPTETWHLNRLLMLVQVCSAKNAPEKKRTRASRASQVEDMRRLNEQRLAARGTRG